MRIPRCKLSKSLQKELIKAFFLGATARATAILYGVNRNTAILFFRKIRIEIAKQKNSEREKLAGVVEVDESYFPGAPGGKRAGRSRNGKFAVFGLFERERKKVITSIIPNASRRVLEREIVANVDVSRSVIFSDQWRGYSRLKNFVDHKTVNHKREFARSVSGEMITTNNIERFWGFAKRHLARFCGGYKHNLPLFLDEIAARFDGSKAFLKLLF